MTDPASNPLCDGVQRLGGARVGVVGDLVADIYVSGLTERVSREAPIPVIRFEKEWLVPGGAANVAVNIAALDATVHVAGLVGDDKAGEDLVRVLESRSIKATGIVRCPERATTTKTRLLAGARHTTRQQLARLDREPDGPPESTRLDKLAEQVRRLDADVDAWIISDYGYACFNDRFKAALREIAATKPVVADSRFDLLGFSGVTMVKPNEDEAIAATSVGNGGLASMRVAAKELIARLDVEAVLLTLGNQGMLLQQRDGRSEHVPAVGTDEIVDLTGAGDTVAAVVTTALAAGVPMLDAVRLSNCAASVVVMKEGAASAGRDELLARIASSGL